MTYAQVGSKIVVSAVRVTSSRHARELERACVRGHCGRGQIEAVATSRTGLAGGHLEKEERWNRCHPDRRQIHSSSVQVHRRVLGDGAKAVHLGRAHGSSYQYEWEPWRIGRLVLQNRPDLLEG